MLIKVRAGLFINMAHIYTVTIDDMPDFPVLIETTMIDDDGLRDSFRISLADWQIVKVCLVGGS